MKDYRGKIKMQRLIRLLKKNYYITSFYRILKHRNNKRFKDSIMNTCKYLELSLENDKIFVDGSRVYYLIEGVWNTNGFFAILRTVLDACAVADVLGFTPFINIENSLYNIYGGYCGTKNMFEYYYKQISDIDYETLKTKRNYVLMSYNHKNIIESMFNDGRLNDYSYSMEYIKYAGRIYAKYFILKNELEKDFLNESNRIINRRKVIGIHIRGTGWNNRLFGHPNPVREEQYIEELDKFDSLEYPVIFVATDSESILAYLKHRYGERIIYYNDVARSNDKSEIQLTESTRKNNGYYLGREVLRDVFTLSLCDVLITGLSQVSLFAQIQKQSRNEEFEVVKVIDNGICMKETRRGLKYRKEINRKSRKITERNM